MWISCVLMTYQSDLIAKIMCTASWSKDGVIWGNLQTSSQLKNALWHGSLEQVGTSYLPQLCSLMEPTFIPLPWNAEITQPEVSQPIFLKTLLLSVQIFGRLFLQSLFCGNTCNKHRSNMKNPQSGLLSLCEHPLQLAFNPNLTRRQDLYNESKLSRNFLSHDSTHACIIKLPTRLLDLTNKQNPALTDSTMDDCSK